MKRLLLIAALVAAAAAGWMAARYRSAPSRLPLGLPADPFAAEHRPRVPPPQGSPPAASAASTRYRSPAPPPPLTADEAGIAAAVDQLTSHTLSYAERRKLLDSLRDSGAISEVAALLKHLAAEDPGDAEVSLTLGEAEIRELQAQAQAGASFTQQGLLALQADADFDAALAADPANWEAQFEKAAALAHWPAYLGNGPEVITLLTSLVAQQQNLPQQPAFAQSYVILGQAYANSGQPDKAMQTWQQGLARFPVSGALQQQIASAAPR
ncbi:MAG TPA: hypothetical protein VFE31_09520 [Opitutaceae bacterium]|jgi:tetratricopeptide (TPR) repeat protein|nr:hypothetical protein [Opitutaceae bacterium]